MATALADDAAINVVGFLPDVTVRFPVVRERFLLRVDSDVVKSTTESIADAAAKIAAATASVRGGGRGGAPGKAERARTFPTSYSASDRETDNASELLYLLYASMTKACGARRSGGGWRAQPPRSVGFRPSAGHVVNGLAVFCVVVLIYSRDIVPGARERCRCCRWRVRAVGAGGGHRWQVGHP